MITSAFKKSLPGSAVLESAGDHDYTPGSHAIGFVGNPGSIDCGNASASPTSELARRSFSLSADLGTAFGENPGSSSCPNRLYRSFPGDCDSGGERSGV